MNCKYTGEVKDGKPHGQGTLIFHKSKSTESTVYKGEWKNGKPHGQGIYDGIGSVYKGGWKDGKYHGIGEISSFTGAGVFERNVYYKGEWKDGKRHGQGKERISYPNDSDAKSDFYEGEWKEDEVYIPFNPLILIFWGGIIYIVYGIVLSIYNKLM